MIAIAHNFTADLDHFQVGHQHDWSDIATLEVETHHESRTRHPRHPSDASIAHRLMKSCLSSLSAYEEIAHQANSWEIRELAQVILRQRWAQCQALVNRTSHLVTAGTHTEPSCAEVRYSWLLALNALEDELLPLFYDEVEKAECLLEEACLDASSQVRDETFAIELRDLALSICGARQCWEELATTQPQLG